MSGKYYFGSFTFDDDPALNWPIAPDGGGASLVRIAPEDTTRNPSLGINWRSSISPGGTPGGDDRQSFAAWLAAHSESGATTDTDLDGFGNLQEYGFGGDPAAPSSGLLPVGAVQTFAVNSVTNTYMTLTFQRSNTAEDLIETVEFSNDLITWPISGVQVFSTDNGDGSRTEVWRSSLPAASNQKNFGRVKFTIP